MKAQTIDGSLVVFNSSSERSSTDLYLLEEILTNVKNLCDLPLALRLEVSPKPHFLK